MCFHFILRFPFLLFRFIICAFVMGMTRFVSMWTYTHLLIRVCVMPVPRCLSPISIYKLFPPFFSNIHLAFHQQLGKHATFLTISDAMMLHASLNGRRNHREKKILEKISKEEKRKKEREMERGIKVRGKTRIMSWLNNYLCAYFQFRSFTNELWLHNSLWGENYNVLNGSSIGN